MFLCIVQGTDEPEEASEEMTELCSLFDEGEPSGSAGTEGTESWEDTADQEHVSQEATIQVLDHSRFFRCFSV